MEVLQQAILDFFSNEKLLKQIRTISVLLILLIIPFVYFGFKDTFTFQALWSWDFGSAIAVITLSIFLATIETKSVAFDLTIEIDDEIEPKQIKVSDNAKDINTKDKTGKKSLNWINRYNKEQQELYDTIKTNSKIDLYEKRALKHRLNGKDDKAKWYDEKITRLRKEPLKDKKFIPYDIKRIRDVHKIGVKLNKKKGNVEVKSNPKRVNIIAILLGMPIRAAGLGILGTIPFVMNAEPMTIFLFYLGYILTMIITIVSQYVMTSYKTTHGYKQSLDKITTLQGILILELDKPKPVKKATPKKTTKKKQP